MAEARRYRYDALLRGSAFGLAEVAATLAPEAPRLILVVDQFEELFRYGEEARAPSGPPCARRAAPSSSCCWPRPGGNAARLHVVITMRSDYFGDCAAYRGLAEAVSSSQYPRAGARTATSSRPRSASRCGRPDVAIEEGLVQRLLVDVEEETDRLPMLQHTLRRLWESAGRAAP